MELSPADCPEHLGHTKPAGLRLWGKDSREVCGVETRRRHARLSLKNSAPLDTT